MARTRAPGAPDPETAAENRAEMYLEATEEFLRRAYDVIVELEEPVAEAGYAHRLEDVKSHVEQGKEQVNAYRAGEAGSEEAYNMLNSAVHGVDDLLVAGNGGLPAGGERLRKVRHMLSESNRHLREADEFLEMLE